LNLSRFAPLARSRSAAHSVARLLAALTVTLTEPATAHVPDEGTARLTLRDEHVEILAEWDLFALLSRSPTEIATAAEEDLASLHLALVKTVERDTTLTVDGTRLPLKATGFPTPPELRALAANLSASKHEHGVRARIRLEARDAVHEPRTLELACPTALGPIHASFVQPAQRYVRAGETASFVVLSSLGNVGTDGVRASRTSGPESRAMTTATAVESHWKSSAIAFLAGAVIAALGLLTLRRTISNQNVHHS